MPLVYNEADFLLRITTLWLADYKSVFVCPNICLTPHHLTAHLSSGNKLTPCLGHSATESNASIRSVSDTSLNNPRTPRKAKTQLGSRTALRATRR